MNENEIPDWMKEDVLLDPEFDEDMEVDEMIKGIDTLADPELSNIYTGDQRRGYEG